MLRPSTRPRGPLAVALVAAILLAVALLAGCGNASSASSGGHDSPQDAAQGFLSALGGYDGSPASLQRLLDWVPPSKRSAAQQSFSELGSAGGTTRFQLDGVSIGSATVDGDSATVKVQARLSICVSGSVGSQSFSTCPPAPVSPNGSFDTLACVREQGQWYVADYSASAAGGATPAPPTPDLGTTAPSPGGTDTGSSTATSS